MRERKKRMTEKKERAALNRGDELELTFRAMGGQVYMQKAVIEEQIGRGASCLTYIVRLFSDEKHSSKMIYERILSPSGGDRFSDRKKRNETMLLPETRKAGKDTGSLRRDSDSPSSCRMRFLTAGRWKLWYGRTIWRSSEIPFIY